MKLLVSLVVLSIAVQQTFAACSISSDVNGAGSIKIVMKPKPMDAIIAAGLGNSKSPMALMNLLQSYTDKATDVINGMIALAPIFNGFGQPAPKCRYYWSANTLFCDNVNPKLLQPLCENFNIISDVSNAVSFPLPSNPEVPLTCENDTVRPWGLNQIRAPEAWAAGYNGTGIVVANIDTGVRGSHVELKDNMRSAYNWFDPIDNTNSPHDTHGHGSHTMGSICGKNVGAAPGATWIACRGCSSQSCDNEPLLACGQWMFCPDKGKLNCTTKPHIINNSWGGGIGNTMYDEVLKLWNQVGIISFFATGNDGRMQCSSVKSPADGNWTKLGYFAVGSSACNDHISAFSSQGPSQKADYMGGLGVSIVGPGSNVKSAWFSNDTAYNVISGTSMSSPYVTGAAAVILSKNKNMSYDQLKTALFTTAARPAEIENTTGGNTLLCTGSLLNGTGTYPNNVYGFGRVDVAAACLL